jgi:WD40 repeat protein
VNLKGWLDECPERLRGWEWRYLHALADQSEGVAATVKGGVQAVAVSADGMWCAAAARDQGEVVVLRCEKSGRGWKDVAHLPMRGPEGVRFSPDGTRLACASRDPAGGVRIYDTSTWTPVEGAWSAEAAWDVAWSPDGRRLVVLSGPEKREGRGTVRIVDVAAGREIADTGMRGFTDVAWSTDGRWIAAGDATGMLRVWDVQRRTVALERRLTKNKVTGVAFGATGLLAACDDDGGVTVVRGEDEWPVECVLDQSRSPGLRAAFSPDGSRLAVASWGNTAWVWNVQTRTLERELRGHGSLVHGVAWEHRGERQTLWTGSYDGTVRAWRMDTPPQAVLTGEEANDPWVSLSADGRLCAAWTTLGRLSVLRLDGAEEVASVEVRNGVVMGFRFLPDSRRLVISGRDGSVEVADPWTGGRTVRAKTPGNGMRMTAMSPSGRYVAGLCAGHGCVVVDLEQGEVVWGVPEAKTLEAIAFEGERVLLTHGRDGVLERWDFSSGERVARGDARAGDVYAGAASADGKWVATAAYDGRVTLMEAKGLSIVASAKIDQSPGMLTFTPDGSRLISTGGDGLVRFWETPSMRPMAAIRAAKAWVYGALTPDGQTLVVKWTGNVMKVWRAEERRFPVSGDN